jgi:hypothetical protein
MAGNSGFKTLLRLAAFFPQLKPGTKYDALANGIVLPIKI